MENYVKWISNSDPLSNKTSKKYNRYSLIKVRRYKEKFTKPYNKQCILVRYMLFL